MDLNVAIVRRYNRCGHNLIDIFPIIKWLKQVTHVWEDVGLNPHFGDQISWTIHQIKEWI